MTYGVDQCRVCGKSMSVQDGRAVQRHLKSLSGRPTMTEKEWRAAGLKAAPTKHQVIHPFDGACFECRYKVIMRVVSFKPYFFPVLAAVLIIGLIVFMIGSIFT